MATPTRHKVEALRVIPTANPPTGRQTIAEMRAYCRVNGITISGPVLAKAEYRTGPHPRCAYAHLPITRRPTVHLFGQRDWTKLGE